MFWPSRELSFSPTRKEGTAQTQLQTLFMILVCDFCVIFSSLQCSGAGAIRGGLSGSCWSVDVDRQPLVGPHTLEHQ